MKRRPLLATKWKICGFLFLATTLNYLDRQTLSILAPILQKDMHLDNQALGWLFAAFYYAYTLSHFAAGPILDRSHLRWAFGTAVLAWSTVSMMTGLAAGFASLIVFRLLLGVMESANWPAAIRIVARTMEPSERTLGNGIFTSGTSVGALIAPAVILGVSSIFGWRWTFVLIGSLGAAWLVGWLIATQGKELEPVWREPQPDLSDRPGIQFRIYTEIVKSPHFFPVLVVSVLVNPCLYFSVNWLPTYFAQQRGLAPGRQLGWILTLIYLGLDLGNLICGTAILTLVRHGYEVLASRRIVLLSATVPLLLCASVPYLPLLYQSVCVLVGVNIGLGIWIALYLTMAQDISRTHVSTAIGVLSGCGSLAGALAMWAVGKITQATSSFAVPMAAFSVAAILAAVAGYSASRGPNRGCWQDEPGT
jgi:MFS transporter, ACS family, aldohexuronate transporter